MLGTPRNHISGTIVMALALTGIARADSGWF